MQTVLAILLVLAAAAFLVGYIYRFLAPRPGRACGGNCCDQTAPQPPTPTKPQTVFFSSADLARRLQARKSP